jgi:hypothetical protein
MVGIMKAAEADLAPCVLASGTEQMMEAFRMQGRGAGDLAQWKSACLASARP